MSKHSSVSIWAVCFLLLVFTSISWLAVSARDVPAARVDYTFQGRVFDGPLGDESRPVPGVSVSLFGANNPLSQPGHLHPQHHHGRQRLVWPDHYRRRSFLRVL